MAAFAFRPEAEAEILEAVDWYETRRKGLGSDFLRSLDSALAVIATNPSAYPEVVGNARRVVLRRFPYSLVYLPIDSDTILVVACFHAARDPRRLRTRI